ncbi:hypothetical protein IMG5_171580, partial [Ichthyophthirius multifiliis]
MSQLYYVTSLSRINYSFIVNVLRRGFNLQVCFVIISRQYQSQQSSQYYQNCQKC